VTDSTRNDEFELDRDLAKFRSLYEQLPNEELSDAVQNRILREARRQNLKRQFMSLITLRAFFTQPITTGIASIVGIAIGVVLSQTALMQGPAMLALNQLVGKEMQPVIDEDLLKWLENADLGKRMEPLKIEALPPAQESYEFYSVLSETEQIVSGLEEEGTNVDSLGYYMVQIGSYNKRSTAEAIKARLVSTNFMVNVQPANSQEQVESHRSLQGVEFYRVLVGPFDTRELVNQANEALKDMGFTTLTLRISNP
jgi:hypothetical protein